MNATSKRQKDCRPAIGIEFDPSNFLQQKNQKRHLASAVQANLEALRNELVSTDEITAFARSCGDTPLIMRFVVTDWGQLNNGQRLRPLPTPEIPKTYGINLSVLTDNGTQAMVGILKILGQGKKSLEAMDSKPLFVAVESAIGGIQRRNTGKTKDSSAAKPAPAVVQLPSVKPEPAKTNGKPGQRLMQPSPENAREHTVVTSSISANESAISTPAQAASLVAEIRTRLEEDRRRREQDRKFGEAYANLMRRKVLEGELQSSQLEKQAALSRIAERESACIARGDRMAEIHRQIEALLAEQRQLSTENEEAQIANQRDAALSEANLSSSLEAKLADMDHFSPEEEELLMLWHEAQQTT